MQILGYSRASTLAIRAALIGRFCKIETRDCLNVAWSIFPTLATTAYLRFPEALHIQHIRALEPNSPPLAVGIWRSSTLCRTSASILVAMCSDE